MKNIRRRCRKNFAEKNSEVLERFQIFKKSRGSCNHFNKFDLALMKKTLADEEALEDFLQDYLTWVSENVEKKDTCLKKVCNLLLIF